MNNKSNTTAFDYLSKILLIGDSSVGKTSIMMRFVNNNFSSSFISTIGIDFVTKIIESSGSKVKLQLWDTAGQERFRAITLGYIKGAHVIIIVYDVCDKTTFANIKYWIEIINEYTCDNIGIILVGNKIDIDSNRQVTFKDGYELGKKYNIPFFECSAKKGINIDLIFDEAAKIHIINFNKIINNKIKPTINLNNEIINKKKCCS